MTGFSFYTFLSLQRQAASRFAEFVNWSAFIVEGFSVQVKLPEDQCLFLLLILRRV